LLAERGEQVGLLIVGGTSLLMLGVVERPTADVDVVGLAADFGYRKVGSHPRIAGRGGFRR
jgi:CO/xanthine dehydrogenase FAD-binding subunit